jgi:hypothetical protein
MSMTTPANKPNYLLRAVLALVGSVIIFLGLNVGLGGIKTLGWQGGGAEFMTITDGPTFGIRDNHIRFIGGIWLGVGLLMLSGAFALQQLRLVLVALTGLIFVGGLARLSALDPGLLFSAAIAPSLVLEIVLFPLLGLWIANSTTNPNSRP